MSSREVGDPRHTSEDRGMSGSRGLLYIQDVLVPLCEGDGKAVNAHVGEFVDLLERSWQQWWSIEEL